MGKQTYHKHYCKRDPQTNEVLLNGDIPISGEHIRDTRITDEVAEELNLHWKESGFIWVKKESKNDNEHDPNPENDNEREKLKKDADELGIKYPKNISTEKLREKVENELNK